MSGEEKEGKSIGAEDDHTAKPLKAPKKDKREEDEDDMKFKQKQREDEAIRKAAAAKMKKK